jgi:myo-inositol-1(or 4)-monophosphatase
MLEPETMTKTAEASLSQTLETIAAGAALNVGDLLVEAFNQGVPARTKAGFFDLVTEYDRRSEAIISDFIVEAYPDSTIVGEEGGQRGQGAVHWYIDPIDGTTNFATGIPFFCVSIGAAVNGKLLAGVVFDPLRGELFRASCDGAFLNDRPLRTGTNLTDAASLLIAAFPQPGHKNSPADYALFGRMVESFKGVRRLGSAALALAYVACGRADVAFEPHISPWDVAAGYLLLTQAGGRYLPLDPDVRARSWRAQGYLALNSVFELEQSVLEELVAV